MTKVHRDLIITFFVFAAAADKAFQIPLPPGARWEDTGMFYIFWTGSSHSLMCCLLHANKTGKLIYMS